MSDRYLTNVKRPRQAAVVVIEFKKEIYKLKKQQNSDILDQYLGLIC